MHKKAFWVGVSMAVLGAAVAIWRTDSSKTLFPGLLALFSFLLVWTTFDLQLWTKTANMKRENPKLVVHRGARGLVGNARTGSLILCVSNPGILGGSLTRVEISNGVNLNTRVMWNWQSLHPLLSSRMDQQPIGSLPVPLLPGSLTALYTTVAVPAAADVPQPDLQNGGLCRKDG